MENICIWLENLLAWINRSEAPAIPFVGMARGRFHNPPAPHIEIVYVLQGQYSDLKVGERQVCIPENHVSLHSVHFGNYSPPPDEATRSWCLFLDVSADRAFEPLAKAPLFCSMNVQHREDLVRLFERLEVRCLAAGRPAPRYLTGPAAYAPPRGEERWTARPYFVKAALLELLAQLLEDARASEPDAGRPLPKGLAAAMEFMGLHYGNPDLTLDDVARAAYLSVDHFGRLFRQHTGMTPMRYLRLTRIDQSRFLLKRTGLRVEEVAREVGFPDPFHFSKVFRHVIGMSPTQYREGKPG